MCIYQLLLSRVKDLRAYGIHVYDVSRNLLAFNEWVAHFKKPTNQKLRLIRIFFDSPKGIRC